MGASCYGFNCLLDNCPLNNDRWDQQNCRTRRIIDIGLDNILYFVYQNIVDYEGKTFYKELLSRFVTNERSAPIETFDMLQNICPTQLDTVVIKKMLRVVKGETYGVNVQKLNQNILDLVPKNTIIEIHERGNIDTVIPEDTIVVLDDFGWEHCSYYKLRTKNLKGVKFDGSFVDSARVDKTTRKDMKKIAKFIKGIGLFIVAEKATIADREWLHDLGVEYFQGFEFHTPQEVI